MNFSRVTLAFLVSISLYACGGSAEKNQKSSEAGLSFKDVDGIRFYEVKRRFSNGLSFNKDGFMLAPTWIIEHKAPDTMLAYSPEKQGMEAFFFAT